MTATVQPAPTEDQAPVAPVAPVAPGGRKLRVGGRMALVMLLVAAVVMLGLGVAVLLVLPDAPALDAGLRYAFGRVFGAMALSMAATLGIPAAIGLWSMVGAGAAGAEPARGRGARRAIGVVAAIPVLAVVLTMLVRGNGVSIIDVGILVLVALVSFGLAAAAVVSPGRWRSLTSALILGLTALLIVSAVGALIA